jgi:tRNA 5-methylaminomethyl-2-thiouridine biosynthesis bifunctional protein
VATLQALDAGRWVLRDAGGGVIAETGLLVLAAGAALPNLLSTLGDPDHELAASLRAQRGQVSLWSGPLPGPAQPTASGGYVLALPGGGLAAGSTASFDDDEAGVRAADQARNHALAERLMGRRLPPPDDGRVGWRLLAADKLPLVGGLIDPHQAPPRRPTQPAHWARRPGLALCGAFASRGITWAPLAADLVVAQVLGWPLPVSRSLQAAVDPARQQVRALRHRDPADARGSAPAGLSA